MTRDEVQLWDDRKKLEREKRQVDRLVAREKDNPLLKPYLGQRERLKEARVIMHDLLKDTHAQAKEIEKSSREKTVLRGELAQAEYKLLEAKQIAEMESHHLHNRIATYEYYLQNGICVEVGKRENQDDDHVGSYNLLDL